MKKKVISVLLAAAIAVSCTACGNTEQDGSTGGQAAGDGGAAPVVAEKPEDIWAPYEETVTISTVMPENAGIQWQEGDDYDNNPWYRAYKDRLNIQMVNDWVSNDYSTKLNLSIADGNIPDVFVVNSQQLEQLYEAGLIWDMTDVFENYASDRLKGYMEQEKDTFATGFYEDRLYGIPQLSYGIIDQPLQVWIRKDWKENLKLEDPKTIEDLEAIAKEFQEEYGGYAITEDQSLESFYILATAWGVQPGIWVEQEDGTIGYGSIQPQMKEVLATFARWYKEGLLNSEFTICDQTKMMQAVINGEVGVCPFYQWWGYSPGPDVVTNLGPEAIFEPYAIPSANGTTVKASIDFANYGYIVVSKKCENPDAVVKLINFYAYLMDEAQEKEDPAFIKELFNNAYPNLAYSIRVINPMTDYNIYEGVMETLAKGVDEDASHLGSGAVKYENSADFIKNQTPEAVGDYLQMGAEKSAYGIAKKMLDEDLVVRNKLWGRKTETLLSAGSTLDDLLKEGFTKIIVGEQPVEYFDTLVDNWMKAGGEQATKEVNETVNAQ